MKYRPEIDGLRAVAVVPVVFFHAGLDVFSGGYVGVDVFFVISGYLITTIILDDLHQDRFSIAGFYERRARRLLPALAFMVSVSLVAVWLLLTPDAIERYSKELIAVVFFYSNIHFWRSSDYFAPAAEESLLLHTWSLAVEEQFYVIYPLFLLAFWRLGRKHISACLLLVCVLSLGLSEWGSRFYPVANFYLLPTRAWELGLGALCAILLQRNFTLPGAAGALGLGLIAVSIFVFDDKTRFPSLYAMVPVGGTCLVILARGEDGWVKRILSLRPLVFVGLVSYSLYLWHQPLFALARIRYEYHGSLVAALVISGLAFLLAVFSWRYVEQPFRGRRHGGLRRKQIFSFSAAALVLLFLAGSFGAQTQGGLSRWLERNPEIAGTYELWETKRARKKFYDDGNCKFNTPQFDEAVQTRLLRCFEKYGSAIAVLGDSHSMDVFAGLYFEGDSPFIFGLNDTAMRVGENDLDERFREFGNFISQSDLFNTVYYTQSGLSLIDVTQGRAGRLIFAYVPMGAQVPVERLTFNDQEISAVLAYLDSLSQATKAVWLGPRVEPHFPLAYILTQKCDGDFALRPGQQEVFSSLDYQIAAATEHRDMLYVSQIDVTSVDFSVDFMNCEAIYWSDGDHWSVDGSRRFIERLLDAGHFDRQVPRVTG